MYVKPTEKEIKRGLEDGWSIEDCERGYAIFDYCDIGIYWIESISDIYDTIVDYEDCAREAERTGYCKIIPVDELPNPFIVDGIDLRCFGWIDTPENRKRIKEVANED